MSMGHQTNGITHALYIQDYILLYYHSVVLMHTLNSGFDSFFCLILNLILRVLPQVDRHIRKLDSDLARFEEDLKQQRQSQVPEQPESKQTW